APGRRQAGPSAERYANISASLRLPSLCSLSRLLVGYVPAVGAGRGELTQLVADHVLVDEDRHMLTAVMNGNRQPHHVGNDHRATRPRLDRALAVALHGLFDLLQQMKIDEGSFPNRAWHGSPTSHSLLLAATDDIGRRPLVLPGLVTLGRHTPGRRRVTTALAAAFTTTMRVINRVHGSTAHGRANALPALGAGLTVGAQR